MVTENDIVKRAIELGFGDAGFTTAEPFPSHHQALESRKEMYNWVGQMGLNLFEGTDPRAIYPEARSIIVLIP
jgi:epoxyqueuosine reductase